MDGMDVCLQLHSLRSLAEYYDCIALRAGNAAFGGVGVAEASRLRTMASAVDTGQRSIDNGSHIGNGCDKTGGGMPSFSDDMAGCVVAQLGDGSIGTYRQGLADDA